MPEFYMIFEGKILFTPNFGEISGSKAENERTRPQHQLCDHNGHRSVGSIVLNKLFMRLCTLFYSIGLHVDA